MSVHHQYGGDLQMLVEEPREADPAYLLFLRWLAERERLEHPVAGPPRRYPARPCTAPGEPLGTARTE